MKLRTALSAISFISYIARSEHGSLTSDFRGTMCILPQKEKKQNRNQPTKQTNKNSQRKTQTANQTKKQTKKKHAEKQNQVSVPGRDELLKWLPKCHSTKKGCKSK